MTYGAAPPRTQRARASASLSANWGCAGIGTAPHVPTPPARIRKASFAAAEASPAYLAATSWNDGPTTLAATAWHAMHADCLARSAGARAEGVRAGVAFAATARV